MSVADRNPDPGPAEPKWLVLIHHLRPKPDYLRVKVGRRLRALGAVAIKNSVYVFPVSPASRRGAAEVANEIQGEGGQAVVCEARFIEGLSDETAEDLFREACDREYAQICDQARHLVDALRRRRGAGQASRGRIGARLVRLQRRFQEAAARDLFGAGSRERAAGLLSLVEDLLQGVDVSGRAEIAQPQPHGTTWVTRRGVMVDRIASSWLIRRFIDPQASFKFVSSRGYRPVPGEIRFDMAGAEFTHEGERCTFEVLIEKFKLRDSALRPIAEIVHDLDLEDARYGRKEAAGVGRMIVGLAIASARDDVRIVQGGAVFDTLYQSFRRRS